MTEIPPATRIRAGIGLIVCAVLMPAVLAPVAAAGPTTTPSWEPTVARAAGAASFPAFAVPIRVVPPTSAATVTTTPDEIRWDTRSGDFLSIAALGADGFDPLAPIQGARVVDVRNRVVADLPARTGTVLPDRAADSGMLRVAEVTLHGGRLRIVARTDAGRPDAVVLHDFDRLLDTLRIASPIGG